MPAIAGLSVRTEHAASPTIGILAWSMAIYAATSLISMAVMSIGVAIFFSGLLLHFNGFGRMLKEIKNVFRDPILRIYFALALALTLALALGLGVALLHPLGYGGKFVEVHFLKDMAKAWYLFFPLFLAMALQQLTSHEKKHVLRVWIGAFAVLAVIGVFQYFTGWPRQQVIPNVPGRFHATLFLGHHLSVASILIFPFFACLDISIKTRNWLLISAGILGALTLGLTYARSLWIGLPLGIMIWGVWSLPRKWGIVLSAVVIAAVLGLMQTKPIKTRVSANMGIGERQELWRTNIEFFKQRPLTGTGWHHNLELAGYYFQERYPGQNRFVGHAHNNLIEMLGSTGAIGTFAWLVWCAGTLFLLFYGLSGQAGAWTFGRGLICAWVVFHVNGLTQVNFWESKVLHQMMWVTAWSLLWASAARQAKRVEI